MGKIIITERQYKKIKNLLIEQEIYKKNYLYEGIDITKVPKNLLELAKKYNINPTNPSYILPSTLDAEPSAGGNELRLFKGTKFTIIDKFVLYAKPAQSQLVDTANGIPRKNFSNEPVMYYCAKGKFFKDKVFYYNENFPDMKPPFNTLCQASNYFVKTDPEFKETETKINTDDKKIKKQVIDKKVIDKEANLTSYSEYV